MDLERFWTEILVVTLCEWIDLELRSEWSSDLREMIKRDPAYCTVLEV